MKRNFCGDIQGDAEGGRHTTQFWNSRAGVSSKGASPTPALSVVQTEQAPCPPVAGETWVYNRGPAEPTDTPVCSVLFFKIA